MNNEPEITRLSKWVKNDGDDFIFILIAMDAPDPYPIVMRRINCSNAVSLSREEFFAGFSPYIEPVQLVQWKLYVMRQMGGTPGVSFFRSEEDAREWCARNGYTFVEFYDPLKPLMLPEVVK